MRVLLVEDDADVSDAVRNALLLESHCVEILQDGQQALAALQASSFDVVILDLGLPRMSGLDVLRRVRSLGGMGDVPILILTARDLIADRVAGLDAGADDYLTKPFDVDELNARIRAITRRRHGRTMPTIECGVISLDPASRAVYVDGKSVEISGREYAILLQLMEHAGQVVKREQLMANLYGWDTGAIGSNTIDVHVSHLRSKLGGEFIRTVRGVGFIVDK
jgi:two-component system response regulator QseB